MNDVNCLAEADALRQKSKALRKSEDTILAAYGAIDAVAESAFANLTDHFNAGRCALLAGRFRDAAKHLSKLISMPHEAEYDYYISQSYFWRSFALFKLKEFDQAESDIKKIINETTPFYVSLMLPVSEDLAFTAHEFADLIEAAKSRGRC